MRRRDPGSGVGTGEARVPAGAATPAGLDAGEGEAGLGHSAAAYPFESSLKRAIQAERVRLLGEAGLPTEQVCHFRRPEERVFTRAERGRVTLLFGGLTHRHEQLIRAGMAGLGYRVEVVPTPSKADCQAGKEYGNNGQCNPTYFTVGGLINYLKRLRDREGLSPREIIDRYVFLTAGACGPCRFGMYEAEYRLALGNAGFDGFRVLLFQQNKGLSQEAAEAGVEFNTSFFLALINGIFLGDLLNEIAYHTRPYEVTAGRTEEVMARCERICGERLGRKNYDGLGSGLAARLLGAVTPASRSQDAAQFLDQLRGDYYTSALAQCGRIIDREIEVDYTRPKPTVKITGEFWAQTTEGDGNFNMFSFLEREGAEVLVEPVATWLAYILNQARNRVKDRRGLQEGVEPPGRWHLARRFRLEWDYRRRMIKFGLADRMIYREYERLRRALGGTAHPLVCQLELVRMGHPYYNSRAGGGEGHLEIAKNIYYTNRELAHMVLSLKPFGCMPSTQSDGAQAAVLADYPEMIYLPIETSGEGDVNAHSRVQMALGEAKAECKAEFDRAVRQTGYTLEEIRWYVRAHRELRRPLQRIPRHKGVVGRAANFVLLVGKLMDKDAAAGSRRRRGRQAPGGRVGRPAGRPSSQPFDSL